MKRPLILLIGGIILIALVMLYFHKYGPKPRPPHIVLISIDALRGDYFSPEYMPKTYAWAKENCALFPNTYSNSTWTSPSHVTMLSGLLQSQHKVEFLDNRVPPDFPLVQETLKKRGYITLAFVGGGYISRTLGFDRGFDQFVEHWMFFDPTKSKRNFRELRDDCWQPVLDTEKVLSADIGPHPLFMFVHTYLVHEYFLYNFDGETYPAVSRNEVNNKFVFSESPETKQKCYGLAVKDMDTRLYAFLQALLNSRLSSNLAIIITSDHGEGLGDQHGEYLSFAHAHAPYSDQIHIPLAVYGMPKGTYENLVCTRDIPGIIRGLAGLENGNLFPKNEFVISENIQFDRTLPPERRALAITFPDRKVLLNEKGKLSLYVDETDTVDALSSSIGASQVEITGKLKDDLRALGYLD